MYSLISEFENLILPITTFRHNMTKILENLTTPKILMNRDKAQAVLVPYDVYKAMECALESQMDQILSSLAEERLNQNDVQYISHDDFWKDIGN